MYKFDVMKSTLYLVLLFLYACQPYPKDTNNSFKEAKTNKLKVGVAINPPFTQFKNGKFTGSEIELIKGFAARENLQIQFIKGSESELIGKMENYQIHVLAGGFGKETIWKKKARPTATYDGQHVLLVAKGENRLLYKLESFIFKTRKP